MREGFEALPIIRQRLVTLGKRGSSKSSDSPRRKHDPIEWEPLDCENIYEVIEDFKKVLVMSDDMQRALIIMTAVVLSTTIDGDQIWIRLIGPPSSGKSTLAESFAMAREYVFSLSQMTGFHSGFDRPGKKGEENDSSLIPLIMEKTMIIKDADTLLHKPCSV